MKVFDLVLPLDQVAEGYRAMDERRAIKTLLRPSLDRTSKVATEGVSVKATSASPTMYSDKTGM